MARPIPKTRRALVATIRRLTAPHFYDSGYCRALDPKKGLLAGSRALRLWAPPRPVEIGGFVLDDLVAITEDGIMTDAYGGGAVTCGYGSFPIEDLQRLVKRLPALLAA